MNNAWRVTKKWLTKDGEGEERGGGVGWPALLSGELEPMESDRKEFYKFSSRMKYNKLGLKLFVKYTWGQMSNFTSAKNRCQDVVLRNFELLLFVKKNANSSLDYV